MGTEGGAEAFLDGLEGEIAGRLRRHDWAATPLGPIQGWPQSLRSAVGLMLAALQPAHVAWGPALTCLYNDGLIPILGAKHPDGLGRPFAVLFAEIWEEFRPLVAATMAGQAQHFVDRPVPLASRPDRPMSWFTFSWTPLRDETGAVAGFFCAATETTEKVLAERALQARRESDLRESRTEAGRQRRLYEAILSNTPDLAYVFDLDHRFIYANEGLLRMWGRRWEEAIGRTCLELGYPDWHAEMHDREIDQVVATRQPVRGEVPFTGTFGRRIYDYILVPVLGADGEVEAVAGTTRDVTGWQETVAALRDGEQRLRLVVETARDYAIFTTDAEDRIEAWWQGAEAAFGWSAEEVVGRSSAMTYTPEDRAVGVPGREVEAASVAGRAPNIRWHQRKDGTRVFIEGVRTALRGPDGRLRGFLKIGQDVTERRRVEEQLRESEARFRHMADSAPALIWMTDAGGEVVFANMHFDHVFGCPAAEMLGRGWLRLLLPEDRGAFEAAFAAAFRARRSFRAEMRVHDRVGEARWLRCEGVPRLDDAGGFLGYTFCGVDITEARLAAEELEQRVSERTAELVAVAETLRQVQKMEAVGQLTGGIAHDFNNMLQGVAGAVELARRRIAEGRTEQVPRYLEAAHQAADRAAGLTRRLLAFARRQHLDPRPVGPDGLIAGMADLIRRTVGPGIRLVLDLREDAGCVLCDANELESALLNLCINARDAMAEGGRLAIGTQRLPLSEAEVAGQDGMLPGEYIVISVADTGTGMPPEVLDRVFEPFFTTKLLGQGTGLGLSQVYGFARQTGGRVGIESRPGEGTTVRLFLPNRPPAEAPAPPPAPAAALPERAGAGEVVLLVDDEAAARGPAAERLRELGYRVLEASDGPTALRILGDGAAIDLLVTDVGLPGGMNGRQLSEAVQERRPDLPVLFITGYAGTALPPGHEVIAKPFALEALAGRVRSLLAAAAQAGAARPAGA
ncbi:PAS domain-containing hybrid sensor histidine kinase/response regulator [Paracraurococcus ruber]|uniref:histidine kinase n=1 Tax=Paracraurococcus ruber TaxID=77675 RepID=A0ABS1CVN8_9PROT|nr:PAS domain S-box protein [Paracraurococcus ruber]MBK1658413.1 hypothetical protein [Paracraurococcus ruber]TDG30761.1 PAS domain S-box protein [Paracraurococcus ruber]